MARVLIIQLVVVVVVVVEEVLVQNDDGDNVRFLQLLLIYLLNRSNSSSITTARSKYLSTLESDSKILVKWHSTGTKQRVEASSMNLVNDKEDEASGRRSSKRRR